MPQTTNLLFFLLSVKHIDMHSAVSTVKFEPERNIARLQTQRTGKTGGTILNFRNLWMKWATGLLPPVCLPHCAARL